MLNGRVNCETSRRFVGSSTGQVPASPGQPPASSVQHVLAAAAAAGCRVQSVITTQRRPEKIKTTFLVHTAEHIWTPRTTTRGRSRPGNYNGGARSARLLRARTRPAAAHLILTLETKLANFPGLGRVCPIVILSVPDRTAHRSGQWRTFTEKFRT